MRPIRVSGTTKSSNLAIGAACAFVSISALMSLATERDDIGGVRSGTWSLRGTIAPDANAAPVRRPPA